jgi:hypothetical protein
VRLLQSLPEHDSPRLADDRRVTIEKIRSTLREVPSMKRAIVSAVIIAATLGISTGTASAGKAVAGCPDSFKLAKASKFEDQTIDKNGDGYVCWTTIPTPPPNFNVIDNNFVG